ncbi:MAG: RsmD family RNA methyltransferase [Chloroflexi bacterium]|nr:RsmD family RNA methyltransferase [Chloroflexota bacterium]
MRVIGGQARGRLLRLPPEATRPTSQKVRAAVFSMVEAQLWRLGDTGWEGLRVLDLFAGSGAYGVEALSRGAAWADFVEHDARACRVIAENLRRAGCGDRARVHTGDALAYVQRHASPALPHAIIFADPPYGYPAPTNCQPPSAGCSFFASAATATQPSAYSSGSASTRLRRRERSDGTWRSRGGRSTLGRSIR